MENKTITAVGIDVCNFVSEDLGVRKFKKAY